MSVQILIREQQASLRKVSDILKLHRFNSGALHGTPIQHTT